MLHSFQEKSRKDRFSGGEKKKRLVFSTGRFAIPIVNQITHANIPKLEKENSDKLKGNYIENSFLFPWSCKQMSIVGCLW